MRQIVWLTVFSSLVGIKILSAQPITGIWKGKMGSSHVELKLVRKGDSLVGCSYYYDSKSNYRRYQVKGYFDGQTNDVIWWDDALVEDHSGRHFSGNSDGALLAVADFNCPGEGAMKLDGKSSLKDDDQRDKKELHLVKGDGDPLFPDEWDFVIDNYAYSVMHPELLDSIEQLAFNLPPQPAETVAPSLSTNGQVEKAVPTEVLSTPQTITSVSKEPVFTAPAPNSLNTDKQLPNAPNRELATPAMLPPSAQSNEQRFINRTKTLQQVIPVKGDSIELRFYDNAEIDGDSIAVFLNGRLLREHILLAEQAYIMKIAVADLQADNELVMVAENMGTIPPNTSLMVAIVEDKRYEAHLQSTEGSSALVRLVKP